MNKLDKDFNSLIKTLRKMTTEEIYQNIRYNYLKLDENIQELFESYFEKFDYWGKLNAKENEFEEIYEKAKFLHDNLEDIVWLYEKLEDYRSKMILYAIINNWYNYDFITLKNVKENAFKHYFDLDLVKVNKDTIFLDLGSYIGDSVIEFINCYGEENYKKIYYEITDLTFSLLKNNLAKFDNIILNKKAVGEVEGEVLIKEHQDISANKINENGNVKIKQVSIDNDIHEKITLVKMDIEGSEVSALKGMKKHIENDMPDLLISVYHRNEDLINIPKIIDEFNSNYKFYLRSHSGEAYPTEIVLFCVKE